MNQNQNQNQNITFTCKSGLNLEQESSETLWLGRLPKGCTDAAKRRDIALSSALPEVSPEIIQNLDPKAIATLLSDSFEQYIKRVRCQRLGLGDSYQLFFPSNPLEYGVFVLTALTEGTREKKLLTAEAIRNLINSDAFKTLAAERIAQSGIKAEAFKTVVIDEFLKACNRDGFCIYTSRAAVATKAIAHLEAIAAALPTASQHQLVLNAAIATLKAAPIMADEEGI